MKKSIRLSHLIFSFSLLTVIFASSCRDSCTITREYMGVVPVYMHMNDLRTMVAVEEAKEIEEPGKIYIYGKYLLINEVGEGIHIVNNELPSNPVHIKFIRIKACTDMAVKDDFLYANQGPDMVIFDFKNPNDPIFSSRVEKVMNSTMMKGDSFPIGSEERLIVEIIEDANCGQGGRFFFESDFATSQGGGGIPSSGGNGTGTGGSMARYTIVDDFIYMVDDQTLITFDISEPTKPVQTGMRSNIGVGLETLFPYKDHLFVGTATGMLVFDRKTSPQNPGFVSSVQHLRGCDPVVVVDDLAYVTLRGGSRCGAADDELMIVDISEISKPEIIITYEMNGPYGLGADNEVLMVCDGEAGLKVFDRTKTMDMARHMHSIVTGKTTYDCILADKICILSAEEGIFQFDYTDPTKLIELSALHSK